MSEGPNASDEETKVTNAINNYVKYTGASKDPPINQIPLEKLLSAKFDASFDGAFYAARAAARLGDF